MGVVTDVQAAEGKLHPSGPSQLPVDSGSPAYKGEHRRCCGRLSLRGALLITAAALLVVAVIIIAPAIVFHTGGRRRSTSGSGSSEEVVSPQVLNQSEVVVYSNLLRAAAFQHALLNRIIGTPQLGHIQDLLNGTIQAHGSYVAHLTDALTASGADAWRGFGNVDSAFPYDLSYGSDNRTAANRTEVAALLATSIVAAVNRRLVMDARELVGTSFGARLDAAAGHPTDARDALVSDFKANLKFAERFPHLKGFLTSEPGMMLQLSTAVAYGNATVSITAVGLIYKPSATYAGERRRRQLLQMPRRALQGLPGAPHQTPCNPESPSSAECAHLHQRGGDHAAAAENITAYNFSSESQRATGSLQGAGLSVAVSTIGDIQQMARRAVDSTVDTSGGLLGGAAYETRRRRQRRRQLQQNGGSTWVNNGFVDVIDNIILAMC